MHGSLPLRGVLIEEPDGEFATYGLIIYGIQHTEILKCVLNATNFRRKSFINGCC